MLKDVGGLLNLLSLIGFGLVYLFDSLLGHSILESLLEGLMREEAHQTGTQSDDWAVLDFIRSRPPFKISQCICLRSKR